MPTARRQDEAMHPQLRDEDVYRSLLDESPHAVFALDASGAFQEVNRAAEALSGYSADELMGLSFAPLIDADDVAVAAERFAKVLGGDPDQREYTLVRKDGGRRRVRVTAVPVRSRGRVVGLLGLGEDVTERAEAERELQERAERLAAVAELGRDALEGASLQALMQKACVRLAELLGVDYAKVLQLEPERGALRVRAGVGWRPDVIGRALVSADHMSQAGYTLLVGGPVVVENLREERRFQGPDLLLDHGVVSGMSVVIHGREGPWGVLGAHARSRRAFSGDEVSFLQSVANVLANAVQRREEEDRLERSIQERTSSLQQALHDLETFTNSVSHDLRAPLRGVDALGEALLEDYGKEMPGEAVEMVQRMLAENRRAVRLVQDILAFSRSGHQVIERRRVDVTRLAREIAADIDAHHSDRRTTWDVEEGLVAEADPRLLRIALYNLLDNASKYSARQAEPRVKVYATNADGTRAFHVRDNGIGFPPAEAYRLFGAFNRLPNAVGFTGTGLGLATAHRIVMRHGGRIWAQSEPGQGATFSFTLG